MAALPEKSMGMRPPEWELWDRSPLGMALLDLRGHLVRVNQAMVRLRGLPVEALVGYPAAQVLPGFPWPFATHSAELQWPGGPVLAIPAKHDRETGTVILFTAPDEVPRLAQHLAETSAARVELETVIQASFDEIFITDGEGRVLQVNAACERFYGLSAEELQGRGVKELESQGIFTPSLTREVIRTRERQTVVQATRTGRRLVVTSIPILDAEGNLSRVVSVSRDVTDLNHLIAQLAETETLAERYRTELRLLNARLQRDESVPVFASRVMQEVLDLVGRVASVDATVLITGESGVGKGQLARLLHRWSPRVDRPFQTIDCAALPESLIESELFGYEGGTFTGANREGRRGLIESADGGTLFLDEIGELPLGLQTKLLRFLQEKTVTRVGGRHPKVVDVRVIAATNRDLRAMVTQGSFREDLFWRLNVVLIHIPPLRERPEDVPALLEYFLTGAVIKYQRVRTLSQEAMTLLCRYPWPGNVRELENQVVRLVVTTSSTVIQPKDLPSDVVGHTATPPGLPVQVLDLISFPEAQAALERQLLTLAMQRCKSTREMAQLLGVNQSTVVRKLKQFFPGRTHVND